MRILGVLSVLSVLTVFADAQVRMRPLPGDEPAPPALRGDFAPPRAQPVPPRAQPVASTVRYAPQPQTGYSDQSLAKLRVGDTFEMRLSGMEAPYGDEFMRQYVVDSDGTVNLPYIKLVAASGLTPGQLERSIQQRLVEAKIFTNPTVNITLQQTTRVISVTGQVRTPQRISWSPDLTLMAAVDLAGGPGDFAKGKVQLLRNGQLISVYEIKVLRRNPATDPKVSPGDRVDVP
jgi:polysaccharide export outer membrane protein